MPSATSARHPSPRRDAAVRRAAAAVGILLLAIPSSPTAGEASSAPAVTLDHVVLGISNLETGMKAFEERAGVTPVIGGFHPDRGTWNALLSVGDHTYLEIIAPNPEASTLDPMFQPLTGLKTLTPVLWLVRTTNADETVAGLRRAGYETSDPQPGSRETPDGAVLRWRGFALTAGPTALAPYFIEWAEGSPHPASTSPAGCRLTEVALQDPKPGDLRALLDLLGLEIEVTEGEPAMLRLRLECKGVMLQFP